MLFEKLSCGLPVLIKQVPNKVVTLDAWVNTGSANEEEQDNGISHFLEHMMFKGTPKHGVGELDRAIMNVGGVWNAGTSKDFTHYYVTVATPFFETALDAISDMLQNSLIDRSEFDREKQVILEEYRRKQDNPYGCLYDELYDVTFEEGPYRTTVLGSFDSISALDRDRMFDYYRRYYSPDNMILMVIGDVEPALVLPLLEKAFENFNRRTELPAPAHNGTRFRTAERRTISKDVNETYMALAYPAPSIAQVSEVFALDLASTILSDGRSSRLYQAVKEKKRLVNSISAGYPTHRYESLFYIIATLNNTNVDATIRECAEQFRLLADTPPGEAELDKARRVIRNSFHFGMETNTGQSGTIGYYYTLTGSLEFLDNYLDRLAAVTPQDVSAIVRKYLLGEPNIVIVEPAAKSNGNGTGDEQ